MNHVLLIIFNLVALSINVPILMFDATDPHPMFRAILTGANLEVIFYEILLMMRDRRESV